MCLCAQRLCGQLAAKRIGGAEMSGYQFLAAQPLDGRLVCGTQETICMVAKQVSQLIIVNRVSWGAQSGVPAGWRIVIAS